MMVMMRKKRRTALRGCCPPDIAVDAAAAADGGGGRGDAKHWDLLHEARPRSCCCCWRWWRPRWPSSNQMASLWSRQTFADVDELPTHWRALHVTRRMSTRTTTLMRKRLAVRRRWSHYKNHLIGWLRWPSRCCSCCCCCSWATLHVCVDCLLS